jgi:uncharacterized DUF497 family protein
MRLTFDPAKPAKTLAKRGLDFADARLSLPALLWRLRARAKTMAKPASSATAISKDAWSSLVTSRGVRVTTLRKANAREQERLAPHLEI